MPEKELTARVRVEREGDAGAVRDLADDLRSVRDPAVEAGDAAEEAGRDFLTFSERLEAAGQVLDELREDLRQSPGDVADLTDALEQKFPIGARAIKEVQAVVETFQQSFDATRAVVDFVETEFGISIDQMVTDALKLEEVGERIVEFFKGSGEATSELLQNQRRIFENLGLDGLSSNVERNAQIIEEHFRSIGDTISTGSQFLSRYGLDAQEATEKAKTFAASPSFKRAGFSVSIESFGGFAFKCFFKNTIFIRVYLNSIYRSLIQYDVYFEIAVMIGILPILQRRCAGLKRTSRSRISGSEIDRSVAIRISFKLYKSPPMGPVF